MGTGKTMILITSLLSVLRVTLNYIGKKVITNIENQTKNVLYVTNHTKPRDTATNTIVTGKILVTLLEKNEVTNLIDGLSAKMDFNTDQLKALGNAVVPQQVRQAWSILTGLEYQIFLKQKYSNEKGK